jgi:hypothetical protein
MRQGFFQSFQARLITQINTLSGRSYAGASESRNMVSFKLYGNPDSPRSDTVPMERSYEVNDLRFEHLTTAHNALEAVTMKDGLLAMYPNLAQWLFACCIDPDTSATGPLIYVPLQTLAASTCKAASFHLERTHLVPSLSLVRPNLSFSKTGHEIDLSGNHHSLVVFVIADEGKIMVDRKRVEVFGQLSRTHFSWVLPTATRNGPYRSVDHLYQAADKALESTFGFHVARDRYYFAGSCEHRAPDGYVLVTYMFEVLVSDVGPANIDPTGPSNQKLQSSHMLKEASSDGYPFSSPRTVTVVSF